VTVSFAKLDKPTIRDLVRTCDEVAAVYLAGPPEVADEYMLEWPTRWGPLAAGLAEQGADAATVERLADAARPLESARVALGEVPVAAFASAGRLLGTFPAPGARWTDGVRVARPAHVYPLLGWAQQHPPYVDVVVDRAGADLEAHPGGGAPGITMTVQGPDDQIARPMPPGFLSQHRAERRAEDSWAHNAKAVAERIVTALDLMGARLLVVSGDVRATQLVLDRLPDRVVRDVEIKQLRGSRSPDGSQTARAALAAAAAREAAAHQAERLLWLFGEERSPGGLAVEGEDLTLDALAAGRVGTLLVVPPVIDDPRPAWFGERATEVAPAARPTPAWDVTHRGRLLDVAVRSALLSGAEVRVVPAGDQAPAEGLGGLCRFR
jgi:hypothetical protein